MEIRNNDLIYKKKYLKYKNKYINEKNKLHGGLTFKSGLYAFFCNEEYAKSQGIIYGKDNDAPSIFDLNNKLSLNGYRLENNSTEVTLLISKTLAIQNGFLEGVDTLKFVGKVLMNTIIASPVVITNLFTIDYSKVGEIIIADAKERNKEDKERTKEDIKQKNNGLPAKIRYTLPLKVDNINTMKNILTYININYSNNINCCIIIDVNSLKRNKYINFFKLPPPPTTPPVKK